MSWSNGVWTVTTKKGPILDAAGMEAAEQRLTIPVPEMIFGSSEASVSHRSGWRLNFDALDALDLVDKTGKNILEVAYTKEWRQSRTHEAHGHDVTKIHRPFDWTYSQAYKGTETEPRLAPTDEEIPFERLKVPNPILFFDEVSLYEDELGDNGMVTYTTKVRVMEKELLLLARVYVRVDGVIFRIRDTRVFVDFEANSVIRTYTEKEDSFDSVLKKIPAGTRDHTQLLRNPDWIASVLPSISHVKEKATFT